MRICRLEFFLLANMRRPLNWHRQHCSELCHSTLTDRHGFRIDWWIRRRSRFRMSPKRNRLSCHIWFCCGPGQSHSIGNIHSSSFFRINVWYRWMENICFRFKRRISGFQGRNSRGSRHFTFNSLFYSTDNRFHRYYIIRNRICFWFLYSSLIRCFCCLEQFIRIFLPTSIEQSFKNEYTLFPRLHEQGISFNRFDDGIIIFGAYFVQCVCGMTAPSSRRTKND